MLRIRQASSAPGSEKIKNLLLSRKYRQYFFPSLVAAVAVSLSEFVDGIVVSNLLDSRALAIVNLGMPLMMLMYAIITLASQGGVIRFSEHLGRRNKRAADEVFTAGTLISFAAGVLVMLVGVVLIHPISNLMCPGLTLGEEVVPYLRMMFLSMPVLITCVTIFTFLPAAGSPKLSMVLNIIANVLNLILDFVYIRIFHMGVVGAAVATFSSYVISCLVLLLFIRQIDLRFTGVNAQTLRHIPDILKSGFSRCLSQVGNTIKFGFCNSMASLLGGQYGLIAMSLCIQTLSIISIFLTGAIDTIQPFAALLRSQNDYPGVGYVLRKTLWIVLWISVGFVLLMEVCPTLITAMYNVVESEALAVALPAIRIFSLCFLFRTTCLMYMTYTSIIDEVIYSTYISLFDGVVGILLIGAILCRLFGLTGLWLTFPVDAFLLLLSIVGINYALKKRYPERFGDLLLVEKEQPGIYTLDLAIVARNDKISFISQEAIRFCLEHGIDEKRAGNAGLAAEEMAVYIRQHSSENELVNLILKIDADLVTIDFRSIGAPFDLMQETEEDYSENLALLRSLAEQHEYAYSLGMNNTRILFPAPASTGNPDPT